MASKRNLRFNSVHNPLNPSGDNQLHAIITRLTHHLSLELTGYPSNVDSGTLGVASQSTEAGFFREVGAPTLIAPAPQQISPTAGQTALEAKVDACIDTLQHTLTEVGAEYPILHTQDCISARAAAR